MKPQLICFLLLLGSCAENNQIIKIKGSDTEVNLAVQLAESFHVKYPDYFVSISGGGSGLGIASLLNGTADMANSSRSIKKEELDLFAKQNTIIDSFIFAQDAIGFVVANDLPIDSINKNDLAKLLDGTYKNWSVLTHKNLSVNIYGRQSNSGTHDFVQQKLGIEFSPYAKEMNGNAQILEAIKNDHSGIGYVGAGYLIHGDIIELKVLKIIGNKGEVAVSPLDSLKIAEGKYLFQRPLFQYFKKNSKQKIMSFIDFENTAEGLSIIKEAGYYPSK